MSGARAIAWLLAACLLLGLAGCGNKGPLVPADEPQDQRKKQRDTRTY